MLKLRVLSPAKLTDDLIGGAPPVNICGMAMTGWTALTLQQFVWSRVSIRRTKAMTRHRRML